ncbi:MAG: AMP-dependent synthetase, partial [Lachnospiraceae bacterium]|nr:AMP-dependent synthetase [Lachnospiraceae bacterium]
MRVTMWNLKTYKNNTAIITDDGIKYTYEELANMSDIFASCIDERCLVFLQCRNRIESLATYVGMLQKRIVPLMLGTSDVSMIESLANEYKPMYICLYKDCNVCNGYYRVDTFYDLVIYKRVEEVRYLIHNDLALLLPTSGTTGSRKYVRLSYENLKVNAESIIEYLDITVDDVTITSMPMSYTYGLSLINTYLLSGATLLLTEKSIITKKFWDFFEANGGTSFSGVPYAYEVLSKTGFFNREIRTLKTLTQAGGKLREDLQDRYGKYASERNIDFYIMYGQTEATARMSYL